MYVLNIACPSPRRDCPEYVGPYLGHYFLGGSLVCRDCGAAVERVQAERLAELDALIAKAARVLAGCECALLRDEAPSRDTLTAITDLWAEIATYKKERSR